MVALFIAALFIASFAAVATSTSSPAYFLAAACAAAPSAAGFSAHVFATSGVHPFGLPTFMTRPHSSTPSRCIAASDSSCVRISTKAYFISGDMFTCTTGGADLGSSQSSPKALLNTSARTCSLTTVIARLPTYTSRILRRHMVAFMLPGTPAAWLMTHCCASWSCCCICSFASFCLACSMGSSNMSWVFRLSLTFLSRLRSLRRSFIRRRLLLRLRESDEYESL
mmetsp:Transcript_10007/g.45747  ORF Transcript_10007/g.45747 Transcript_10007/m.45747 type:complete len:225 (-) Transcript_10007:349-1023(-)